MKKHAFGIATAVMSAVLVFGVRVHAQDFQKTYTLTANGIIQIRNISGDIIIEGYDGSTVAVEAFRVGRNRDLVEVVDRSLVNRIELGVRYPEMRNFDASVNFHVRVPRAVALNFESVSSVSGSVHFSGLSGRLTAESVSGSVGVTNVNGEVNAVTISGNVDVKNVSGIVKASSTSGNVEVYLRKIEGAGDMRFASISGNVVVKAPADLDASISMSSLSGMLSTDFPIEIVRGRYAPGSSARGRVGNGTHNIRISSVSGRVSLLKGGEQP